MDLDELYRPTKLDDVVGQDGAVKVVRGFKDKIPRAVCFEGDTGAGKTTLARIVVYDILKIGDVDYREINCGVVESAIDMVRQLNVQSTAAPMSGKFRVWTLDEVQVLSRTKYAQEALLKVLGDAPSHVIYILCTTDPKRLLPAIRGRCVRIPLKTIGRDVLIGLLKKVAKAEKQTLTDDLLGRIADAANGSARNALKELQKVLGIEVEADRVAAISGQVGAEKAAIDLVKELMPYVGSANWAGVCKVLEAVRDEDPEGIRQVALACARSTLIKDVNKNRHFPAYKLITCLDQPFYDKASGHALLAAGCYRFVFGSNGGAK